MKSSFVVTFALALLGATEASHLARRGLNNHQLARDGGGTHAARTVPCKRGTDGTPDCGYPGYGHHYPGGPWKPGKPGHGGDDGDDDDPVVTPTAGIPEPPPPVLTPTPTPGVPGGNNTLPVEPPVIVEPVRPDPPVVSPPPVATPVPTPDPGYGGGDGSMTVQPIDPPVATPEPGVPQPTPEPGNGDDDEDCDDDRKKARRGFRFWA